MASANLNIRKLHVTLATSNFQELFVKNLTQSQVDLEKKLFLKRFTTKNKKEGKNPTSPSKIGLNFEILNAYSLTSRCFSNFGGTGSVTQSSKLCYRLIARVKRAEYLCMQFLTTGFLNLEASFRKQLQID